MIGNSSAHVEHAKLNSLMKTTLPRWSDSRKVPPSRVGTAKSGTSSPEVGEARSPSMGISSTSASGSSVSIVSVAANGEPVGVAGG